MSLLGNGLKGNIFTGLAIGIGAAILAPAIIPVVAGIAKPLVKAAIKGGVVLYDKGKETFAETKEIIEDLVAEAKAELSEVKTEMSEVKEEASETYTPGE
jgi:hypothetical protein